MRSTKEIATCAAMRALRARSPACTRGAGHRAGAAENSRRGRAGTRPNTIAVAIDTPAAKRSTVPSMRISAARGVKRAVKATSSPRVSDASSRPSAPPRSASSVLSVSSWRAMRARPAPSAARIASSRAAADEARQREVRDVRAHEQQHEAGGAEQHQQRRAGPPRQLVLHRQRGHGEARSRRIRRRGRRLHALRDEREIAADAIEARAGAQAADRGDHPRGAIAGGRRRRTERARRHRHVDVVLLRVLRHGRQHADDGVHAIVHLEGAADDAADRRRAPAASTDS